ncbi:ABC transporter permease [Antribacter sp. KLBMP9083]|uniref:ABC transporter permease n=1 Tax=Antribacter soli TaxID=2910976 RepID=A0AA41UAY0_9MICO|nr:ABC transporter permease [Antribacter soli]MCF4120584.1 ABC transporter permease [Antribacter soli]
MTRSDVGRDTSSAWLLVTQREVVVRALNKSFVVGLLVSLGLIAGLMAFFTWQGSRAETFTVAVEASDTAAAATVAAAAAAARAAADEAEESGGPGAERVEVMVLEVTGDDAARAALEDETADAWLSGGDAGWTLTTLRQPDLELVGLLTATVREEVVAENATAAGTSPEELTAGSELATESLDGDALDPGLIYLTSFVLAFLFFMGAVGSGAMIAGSVIEEKQSRLVEIIATAVPLRHVLAGKILGSSVIALAQNLLFGVVGLAGISFTPWAQALPALSASMVWFVVFFTVGFVAVAALYAVAGALASRTEDLQATTTPLMLLLMGIYVITFSADGVLERVLSFVPVASIVSMPVRVLSGDAQWWEPVVSLLLLVAFAVGAVLVSERAYRGALLQTGGRLTWRQALRAEA